MEKEDKNIIEDLRSGNEDAFRGLFDSFYQKLVVYANKYLNDLEASKDLVQEFFMNLYESAGSIDIHTSLKSYLYASVKNRCLNTIKYLEVRSRHHENMLLEEIENNLSVEDRINQIELEEKIYRLVSGLPEQCRKIYIMSRSEGRSNKEIAEELELSVRTVETHISRALKSLREKLLPLD